MALRKETMAYQNKLKYIKHYSKGLTKVYLQFNPRTELDFIEWLADKQKATYIKKLIRADMEKNSD